MGMFGARFPVFVGRGTGAARRKILEEGRGAKKEPGQMKWSLYEMFPVCKHVSGCFIFFITNKSNTATPTMKKMY